MIILSLASTTANKGDTITMALSIASTGGDQCTGVQWAFGFTANVALVSVAKGPAAANKVFNESGTLTIGGGFDINVIPDGVLAIATFKVAEHPVASVISILVAAVVATDVLGNALTVSSSPGTIAILLPFRHPRGLSLNPATGEITGSPQEVGSFQYTVRITDALGATDEITCEIDVNSGITRGMSILTAKQWATIREKGIPGLPTDIYFDHDYPNAGFHLWPVPNQNYGIQLFYWAALTAFATKDSAEELPQGYYDLLVYELAMRLCQVYRRAVPAPIQALAKNARKMVADLNAQIIDGSFQESRTLDGPNIGEPQPKALGPPEPRLLPGSSGE